MNCYLHPETVAVGSCKHCCKGVCASCAVDTGVGLACTMACELRIKAGNVLAESARKSYVVSARSYWYLAIYLGASLVYVFFAALAKTFPMKYGVVYGAFYLLAIAMVLKLWYDSKQI